VANASLMLVMLVEAGRQQTAKRQRLLSGAILPPFFKRPRRRRLRSPIIQFRQHPLLPCQAHNYV
jgi:hypothetical protein